jgi:hypothetical protein
MMSRRTGVGTLVWVRRTDGILERRDRWTLLGQAFLYAVAMLPAEGRRLLGLRGRRSAPADRSVLVPPDSKVSRDAERLVAGATPPVVANHSRRTYAWAAALAALDGYSYDREVVYVASLLHDLYFARPNEPARPHCFTMPAADYTISFVRRCGWTEGRAAIAAEAITLHASVWPPRNTVEAYLVFAGSRLDIVGYRYGDLHPDMAHAVLNMYPRLDLNRRSSNFMSDQAAANPGSRVDFLSRLPGAEWFMRRSPFPE